MDSPCILKTVIFATIIFIGFRLKKKYFNLKQRNQGKELLNSLGFQDLIPTLDQYEMSIASQLINPSDIDVTFKDIAGLDDVVDAIKSNLILPLRAHSVLKKRVSFIQPPKGVLLHGPPGCGKTMIAKATAKEANARFINLAIPSLTSKWYGESQKYAQAVFTLAKKLQPCIIFVDEIDTFLRSRGRNDHEATAMVKAQFMILWDGLGTKKDECGVMVLGATNRPNDVDAAILRRMPSRFEISKPTVIQREKILRTMLINESLDDDVDFKDLAEKTDNFSSSDLKELCRNAVLTPFREEAVKVFKNVDQIEELDVEQLLTNLRKINNNDFQSALKKMNENKLIGKNHICSHTHSHNEANDEVKPETKAMANSEAEIDAKID